MAGAYEMSNRTTSAGYRLPLQSRPRSSSEYHQNCIPADKRAPPPAPTATSTKQSDSDNPKLDAVTQDTIWKQAVDAEKTGVKQW